MGADLLGPCPDEDAAKLPANFFIDEMGSRLSKGPLKFRIVVQLAVEGVPVNDATAVWTADWPTVELGVLSINNFVPNNDVFCRCLIVSRLDPS